MLTGDALDVDEAHRLGMVSKVFPRDELDDRTLEFARRIAELPTMTALLIKESVNQTVDNMGFYNALQACFTLHQLNHSHWAEVHDDKRVLRVPSRACPTGATPPVVLPRRTRFGPMGERFNLFWNACAASDGCDDSRPSVRSVAVLFDVAETDETLIVDLQIWPLS